MSKKLGLEEVQETGCYPDNWQALQVFNALSTQWNVGMNGPVGMRYESYPVVFTAFGINKKAQAEMLYLLRILEDEALRIFRENG